MTTGIRNVRLFDGINVHKNQTVVIQDGIIASLNSAIPCNATIIDGTNHALLPGLIDSHTHSSIDSLALALKFGITTELEMLGHWTSSQREDISQRNDIADLRTAECGMTVPDGHPFEMYKRLPAPSSEEPLPKPENASTTPMNAPTHKHAAPPPDLTPPTTASTPAEARAFVAARIADGADYIKIMIEEGTVLQEPGLPQLAHPTIETAVDAAHRVGKLAIAHTLTAKAAEEAVRAGVDGLAHVPVDECGPDLISAIAESGVFVETCICLNASLIGSPLGADFANNPRVHSKLPKEWLDTLKGRYNTYPEGDIQHTLSTIRALHAAGVPLLAGTDAAIPHPAFGGIAHGASLHHELRLLVEAGLTPVEALRAATSVPAKVFRLEDRGRVEVGMRADLVLVEGDPTVRVEDSLNVRGVWKKGVRLGGI